LILPALLLALPCVQNALANNIKIIPMIIDSKDSAKIQQHYTLARALIKSGVEDMALAHLDSLLILDYAQPEAWFLKGQIHIEQNAWLYAERSLERALRYSSMEPEYITSYGDLLMRQGRDSVAIFHFERAHHLAFEWGTPAQQSLALTKLGQYYFNQKQTIKADSLLSLAMQYDSHNAEAKQTLRQVRGPGALGIDFGSPITWIILGPLLLLLTIALILLVRWRHRMKEQRDKLESARNLYSNIFEDDLARYNILQELRRSSISSVYKAFDTKLDRYVAIKIIHLEDMSSDEVLMERIARFRLEARLVAQLEHQNIVKLYDYNETTHDYYYMVMEFVKGKTLKQIIDQHLSHSLSDKLNIIKQICRALEEAHRQDIWHRDVKPSNIMLDENGNAKVLDFGLAKLQALTNSSILTMTGMLVGTPMYMAPEQIRARNVDHRADIYSLGVTFYELLCGQKPFTISQDDSSYVLFSAVLNDEPPQLSSLKKDIPAELESIVAKMMAKRPERRYFSVKEVRKQLEELQS
jgi:tetratricopeptide (TPR) repeat protein